MDEEFNAGHQGMGCTLSEDHTVTMCSSGITRVCWLFFCLRLLHNCSVQAFWVLYLCSSKECYSELLRRGLCVWGDKGMQGCKHIF